MESFDFSCHYWVSFWSIAFFLVHSSLIFFVRCLCSVILPRVHSLRKNVHSRFWTIGFREKMKLKFANWVAYIKGNTDVISLREILLNPLNITRSYKYENCVWFRKHGFIWLFSKQTYLTFKPHRLSDYCGLTIEVWQVPWISFYCWIGLHNVNAELMWISR